jgi:hypothetical protein
MPQGNTYMSSGIWVNTVELVERSGGGVGVAQKVVEHEPLEPATEFSKADARGPGEVPQTLTRCKAHRSSEQWEGGLSQSHHSRNPSQQVAPMRRG